MNITATLFNYFHICSRKLWLHAHHIQYENESETVALGRLVHETSYPRQKKKEVIIEGIKVDFFDGANVVHEVKKSNRMEQSDIWQLKYYLYVLAQKGIFVKGKLNYPQQRKTLSVVLEKEDTEAIEQQLEAIQAIVQKPSPPKVERMKLCKKCSFEEFCWG